MNVQFVIEATVMIIHSNVSCPNRKYITAYIVDAVNSTAQGFSVKDWMTDGSYFNISEIKLFIIFDAPKYNIIWTENNDVIHSFISDILKYESPVIESLTEKP